MNQLRHKSEKAALKRGFRKNKSARYPLTNSPLLKLTSIHLLARLLRLDVESMRKLSSSTEYNFFTITSKPNKPREVQEPLRSTMRTHYRFVKLLDSIQRPDFLQSATRNCSNITNAEKHKGGEKVVKTDIKSFYQNTTFHHVKSFFHSDLGWPRDIAKMMALICTVNGHLPTGSCLSPLLSYWVHRKMFENIQVLCESKSVTLTLYVDDLILSGKLANKSLLKQVKNLIGQKGLLTHKDVVIATNYAATVTGVIVDGNQIRVPNEHRLKIINSIDDVANGKVDQLPRLRSQIAYAGAIEPKTKIQFMKRLQRKKLQSEQGKAVSAVNSGNPNDLELIEKASERLLTLKTSKKISLDEL
jgi:Reverse transcriptase (RNA-dependent DNA polymerase)